MTTVKKLVRILLINSIDFRDFHSIILNSMKFAASLLMATVTASGRGRYDNNGQSEGDNNGKKNYLKDEIDMLKL